MAETRTIKVDYLARVEGEGALWVEIENNKVKEVKLKIFEPPRFFESFLQGKSAAEAPDITARICGICPVAYQMSATHAIEQILDIVLPEALRDLRRLLYCGEWIESHGLHIYMLHAPDFLNYPDAIQMAKDHSLKVRSGLELKKIGNEILQLLGGREIHPINIKIGGFYKLPTKTQLLQLKPRLEKGLLLAHSTLEWTSGFEFPEFNCNYEFIALHHEDEYAMNEGDIVSSFNLTYPVNEFENHFEEEHVPHSNALHCSHKGFGSYLVGPMARMNLNFKQLPPHLQILAKKAGLSIPCANPFQSILVRSVELIYAFEEALRIIDKWEDPGVSSIEKPLHGGQGCAATEAPRGLLYHRYDLNSDGKITQAKIVPPTSQNQKQIENDLFHFVSTHLHLDDTALTHQCEQAIRNYDPCISCATHFLKLHIQRDKDKHTEVPSFLLAIGNAWRSDDGLGPHLFDRLDKSWDSRKAKVLGEMSEIFNHLADCKKRQQAIIIIDVFDLQQKPGTLIDVTWDEIKNNSQYEKAVSSHGMGLWQALKMAENLSELPHSIRIIGLQGENFSHGNTLSKIIEERLPELLQITTEELKNA